MHRLARPSCAGSVTFQFGDHQLLMERHLGQGAFGEVLLCRCLNSEKMMAVKLVRDQSNYEAAAAEATRHQRAESEAKPTHVPRFHFLQQGYMCNHHDGGSSPVLGIGMEFIDGCSVKDVIARSALREHHAVAVMCDLLQALARLHGAGIVHCDVKGDNLLVSKSGICYLCDFGVTIFMSDYPGRSPMQVAGTPTYMAPELFRTSPVRYTTKADLWSAGILAFELSAGVTPFDGRAYSTEMIFELLRDIDGIDLDDVGFSASYHQVLEQCLEVDPDYRASAVELLRNPTIGRVRASDRQGLAQKALMARSSKS